MRGFKSVLGHPRGFMEYHEASVEFAVLLGGSAEEYSWRSVIFSGFQWVPGASVESRRFQYVLFKTFAGALRGFMEFQGVSGGFSKV